MKKAKRTAPAVNAGSMADIAFLLLIFFLVTTTIVEDEGILVRLPIWAPDPPTTELLDSDVLTVKVNKANQLLVESKSMDIANLKDFTKEFILNPNQLNSFPSSPQDAIVSLQNDRATSYETYIEVYNEIMAAYNEIRDDAAQKQFKQSFKQLSIAQRKAIRETIPMVVSEAEPTDFGAQN